MVSRDVKGCGKGEEGPEAVGSFTRNLVDKKKLAAPSDICLACQQCAHDVHGHCRSQANDDRINVAHLASHSCGLTTRDLSIDYREYRE